MKKEKAAPKKLTTDDLKAAIRQMADIVVRIKALEARKDELQGQVVATLGIGGVFQWDEWRVTVVRQMRRTVPWREVAMGLAKKLFARPELMRWARELVKKYPKKATKPFCKLTAVKEKEEAA